MASKAEKAVDTRISRAYSESCEGVQINIMDIPKVYRVGRQAILNGCDDATLRDTIRAFVHGIRQ